MKQAKIDGSDKLPTHYNDGKICVLLWYTISIHRYAEKEIIWKGIYIE